MEKLKEMIIEYFEDENYKNISILNDVSYDNHILKFEFTLSGKEKISAHFDDYGLNIDNIVTDKDSGILHRQLTHVLDNLQAIYKEYLRKKRSRKKTIYDLEGSFEENIDHYYEITSYGKIEKCWFWSTPKSWRKIKLGNAFLTREEAVIELAKRYSKERILRSIREINDDWTPELGDNLYYIQLNTNKELSVQSTKTINMPLSLYIKDELSAKKIAKKHYEDYLVYFGVNIASYLKE